MFQIAASPAATGTTTISLVASIAFPNGFNPLTALRKLLNFFFSNFPSDTQLYYTGFTHKITLKNLIVSRRGCQYFVTIRSGQKCLENLRWLRQ